MQLLLWVADGALSLNPVDYLQWGALGLLCLLILGFLAVSLKMVPIISKALDRNAAIREGALSAVTKLVDRVDSMQVQQAREHKEILTGLECHSDRLEGMKEILLLIQQHMKIMNGISGRH